MSSKFLTASLAILLVIALVVPATFFIAPQRVSADGPPACTGGVIAGLAALFSLIKVPTGDAITAAASTATGVATIEQCLNEMVLKPAIRAMVRMVLQQFTKTVVDWINGANTSGQPSFVQSLARHMQALGDAITMPFINQVRTMLSPQFGAAIASSLLMNYAKQSSIGGFLAGNQSTLGRFSQNPNAFLAGDWSKGGTSAWFALTTQNNNNPYLLAQAAQSQLGGLLGQAQTNRRQDLTQSNGFLSSCGPDTTTAPAEPTEEELVAAQGSDFYQNDPDIAAAGVSPSVPCRNRDGTEGKAVTPGIAIQQYTQQLLSADVAQYIDPREIDAAFGIILQTAVNVGIKGITTGLFDVSGTSSLRPMSITNMQYNTATNNLGAQTAANTTAQSKLAQVAEYSAAWTTIANAAVAARDQVTALKQSCQSQAGAADAVLNGKINPVINQAQVALSTAASTKAFAQQVQQNITGGSNSLGQDTATLAALPPSAAEVTSAKANAATTPAPGGATADSSNPLSVSGGTTVDQMNLINGNAQQLRALPCPTP